jgi:phytoene synthase
VVADASYAACLRIARRHYENFPVASWLLPRAMRPHIAAIYAFARMADDFADEGTRDDRVRLALLDNCERRLLAAAAGRSEAPDESDDGAVFTALGATIRRCHLDVQLFVDLLDAFRQDVLVKRYETWEAVLEYCRRSANPVGRLVLAVAGHRDPPTWVMSDALCTALQLTNFWQDLGRDWQKGRLYVPTSIVRRAGAVEADLDRGYVSAAWQRALRDVARRTRALFQTGRPVADAITGRLRWELRVTWLGGVRILDRVEAAGFDVFRHRPSLDVRDAGPILWRAIAWRRSDAGAQESPAIDQ